jgi:hypothetical protein
MMRSAFYSILFVEACSQTLPTISIVCTHSILGGRLLQLIQLCAGCIGCRLAADMQVEIRDSLAESVGGVVPTLASKIT